MKKSNTVNLLTILFLTVFPLIFDDHYFNITITKYYTFAVLCLAIFFAALYYKMTSVDLKKKITQSNDSLLENKMDIYSKKKSNWRYVFKSIQRNIKDLVVNYIPVSIIFMLFITIFLFLYSISINDLYEFYSGIDNKTIYVSTTHYTKKYLNECSKNNYVIISNDGKRISFSNKDLEDVKNISGVKEAKLYNGNVETSNDSKGNGLNLILDKNSFSNKIKKTKSYMHFPDKIQMEFKTLTVPYPYIKHYNPKRVELLYGNYPIKNEILVPDFLAYNYLKNEKINTLVGQSIELPIINEKRNQENQTDRKQNRSTGP